MRMIIAKARLKIVEFSLMPLKKVSAKAHTVTVCVSMLRGAFGVQGIHSFPLPILFAQLL